MKFKHLLISFFLLKSFSSFAQLENREQIPFIISEEVITKGTTYHDDGKYQYAVEEYDKIPANDTNYAWSLYEKGLSLSADSQFIAAEKALRECLEHRYYDHGNVYSLLGSTLDDEGKIDEAIAVFEEGLKEYPDFYLLHYNYGITLNHKKDIEGAVREFQTAVYLNPFHAGSHLQLGLLCYKYNQPIPCLLSFTMFLMLKPNSNFAVDIMLYMQDFAQLKEPQIQPDSGLEKISLWPKGENDFNKYNFLLHNGQAKSKSFKGQTKISFDLAKQMDLIFQNITYNPKDNGFWNKVYAPVYQQIQKQGNFPSAIYLALSNLDRDDIQKYVKKHGKDLDAFATATRQVIVENSNTFPLVVNGKTVTMNRIYGNNNYINVLCDKMNYEKNIASGKCYVFWSNMKVKAVGEFDATGEKTGAWKYYDEYGTPSADESYLAGKIVGAYMNYYDNGFIKSKYNTLNGKENDTAYFYYTSGALSEKYFYKNGEKFGPGFSYYKSGGLDSKGTITDGHVEGEVLRYYESGQLKIKENFKTDELDGHYESYFENGKLKSKGEYKKGDQFGKWEYYYDNGTLSETETYVEGGKIEGTLTSYFKNGTVESTEEYKNGNESHYVRNDEDGKKNYEMFFDAEGKLTEYNFFSKNGDMLQQNKIAVTGRSPIKGFYPTGEKWFTGYTLNNKRDGKWEYFYINGLPDYSTEYVGGYQVGDYKSYDKTGWLISAYTMKDDDADGYFRSYYSNGKIHREGWYKSGNMEGVWHEYYPDGKIKSDEYYINNDSYGTFTFYDYFGHITRKDYFRLDYLETVEDFDTLGNIICTSTIPGGNGHLRTCYINGSTEGEGEYKSGDVQDGYKLFHANGKTANEGHYQFGKQTGEWTSYDDKGVVRSKTNFKDDDYDGKYTRWEDGFVATEGFYKEGNYDSTWTYYHDKSKAKEYVSFYKDGEKNGYVFKYSIDGQVAYRMLYKYGLAQSYSYQNADGSWLPEIKLNSVDSVVAKYKNGKTSVVIHIKDGYYEGAFKWYYPSGQLKESKSFAHDMLEGPAKFYNDKGVVTYESTFSMDKYEGKATQYYDDGKVKCEENWYNDDRNGTWKYYDKTGKPTKTEIYWLDSLMN